MKGIRVKFVGVVLVSLLIGGGVLSGCRSQRTTTATRKLTVVTTTDFYGEVARAVGGDRVKVTAIINRPSVDPHDYEPTTAVAKTVGSADIAVANGIGYDGWMNRLVKSTGHAELLKVGEDVMDRHNGDNEHLWYDVQTMPALANALATKLGQRQPKNRAYFKANARRYVASLKPIDREITALKSRVARLKTKRVLVSEPVFDTALTTIGLKVVNTNFENAIEKGTDPAPRVITQMQTDLKQRRVALFVDNQQVTSKTVDNMLNLARQNHVPVLKVTETMPANTTYPQWMLRQYRQLNKLLSI